jgi:hypothetical protein
MNYPMNSAGPSILHRYLQIRAVAEAKKDEALTAGAMLGEFSVCVHRMPLGQWPRFSAVLR